MTDIIISPITTPKHSSSNLLKLNSEERKLKRFTFDFLNNQDSKHRIYIECHRGVNKEEPENTLAAFDKAIELDCDSIEMDIWLTKDNIPIVIHGDHEGRVNENSGKITNYIYEEISQIKLEKNLRIPKLEDVFKLCKNKIFLNLEIKDADCQKAFKAVFNLILDYEMQNQVAISSFNHRYFDEIKSNGLDSKVEFGFLYDKSSKQENKQLDINFHNKNSTINLYYKDVTEELVKQAHENGIGVLAWFNICDDESDEIINCLINCKIDVICSNNPRKILMLRKKQDI